MNETTELWRIARVGGLKGPSSEFFWPIGPRAILRSGHELSPDKFRLEPVKSHEHIVGAYF